MQVTNDRRVFTLGYVSKDRSFFVEYVPKRYTAHTCGSSWKRSIRVWLWQWQRIKTTRVAIDNPLIYASHWSRWWNTLRSRTVDRSNAGFGLLSPWESSQTNEGASRETSPSVDVVVVMHSMTVKNYNCFLFILPRCTARLTEQLRTNTLMRRHLPLSPFRVALKIEAQQ